MEQALPHLLNDLNFWANEHTVIGKQAGDLWVSRLFFMFSEFQIFYILFSDDSWSRIGRARAISCPALQRSALQTQEQFAALFACLHPRGIFQVFWIHLGFARKK